MKNIFIKIKNQKKVDRTSKYQKVIDWNNGGIYRTKNLVNGNDMLQNYSQKLNWEVINRNKRPQNIRE